ncbi:hypothetical protein B0H14DRAFT_3879995 [Mycena olivaceomarginata]|nr:hypothetical protein B0H14DRAFT_3879995 [Mycena olivaceomarginata]
MPEGSRARSRPRFRSMHNPTHRALDPNSSSSTGSWSSGHGLVVPDTDDEGLADVTLYDESGDKEEPAVKPKKTRKVSAARQKKADLERPQVRSAPQVRWSPTLLPPSCRPAPSPAITSRRASSTLPPGKDVRLNDQPDACKAVVRGAIVLLKSAIFFENLYMQILSRTGFGKGYLIQSAKNLGDDAVHIQGRLMTDPKYPRGARRSGTTPPAFKSFIVVYFSFELVDRVNIIHGSIKEVAANVAPEATQKLVEELLKDHRYIFGVDPHTFRIKTDEPFLHSAIIVVIKQAILTGAFKTQVEHLFALTDPDYPERLELPDAMICIATTAVYATLAINFTEAAYEDTYRNHMKTLADTRVPICPKGSSAGPSPPVPRNNPNPCYPSAGSSATLINLVDIPGA